MRRQIEAEQDGGMTNTYLGSAYAYVGRSVGRVGIHLREIDSRISVAVEYLDAGYDTEFHNFGSADEVDAFLFAKFPKGWKAGLYELGAKFVGLGRAKQLTSASI